MSKKLTRLNFSENTKIGNSKTTMENHTIFKVSTDRTESGPGQRRVEWEMNGPTETEKMGSWWSWVWLWCNGDLELHNQQRSKMFHTGKEKLEARMFLSWGGIAEYRYLQASRR